MVSTSEKNSEAQNDLATPESLQVSETCSAHEIASVPEASTGNAKPRKRGNNWDDVSRRTWQETKRSKVNNDASDSVVKEDRKPKRKVACLIGYCGTGYHGMQLNPPNKTIEGAFLDAFIEAGAISKDNADDPKKVSFARAARTDKGVHAAVNCISLKMIIEDPEIVPKINALLPEQIRLWNVTRTMKSFNPRTSCDSRVYEYLIPSSAFLPPSPETKFHAICQERNGSTLLQDSATQFWAQLNESLAEFRQSKKFTSIRDDDPDVGTLALDPNVPEDQKPAANARLRRQKLIKNHIAKSKRAFRISEERKQLVRDALAVYIGTKNFHNYTVGQNFAQPNSKRIMRSFDASEPFLINGTEWLSLKVHGQSFMLHQIRKMVAMALLVVRSGCPLPRMQKSFESIKINIPKAPSLGLLLERPIFDAYNKRAGDMTTDRENVELGDLDDNVFDFKMKYVYDKIYAEEEQEGTFQTFLSSIDAFGASGEFEYLFTDQPSEGTATRLSATQKLPDGNDILAENGEASTVDNEG